MGSGAASSVEIDAAGSAERCRYVTFSKSREPDRVVAGSVDDERSRRCVGEHRLRRVQLPNRKVRPRFLAVVPEEEPGKRGKAHDEDGGA